MNVQLIALAMNDRLSDEEFLSLSKEAMENQLRLMNTMTTCALEVKEKYGTAKALQYVTQCLPFIM